MALTFASKITVCRILAVPFFISSVLLYAPEKDYLRLISLCIFLFAVITDILDGYIAKVYHQKSRAGAILDPLADKFLIISAYICLYYIRGHLSVISLPVWLVVAVVSRDVILLMGAAIIQIIHGDFEVHPSYWGKATAFFQVVTVLGLLLQIPQSVYLWPVTLVLTVISGIHYVQDGIKIINGTKQ